MTTLTNIELVGGDGSEDPFARGGIQRSPPRIEEMDTVTSDATEEGGNGNGTPVATPDRVTAVKGTGSKGSGTSVATPDGPSLLRAIERSRSTEPKVLAASQQLDAIIEFTASRNNIAKDLKQSLHVLRKTIRAAKKEYFDLEARVTSLEEGRLVALDEHIELQARVLVLEESRAIAEQEARLAAERSGKPKDLRTRSVQTACICQSAGLCATSSEVTGKATGNKRPRDSPGHEQRDRSKKSKSGKNPESSSSAAPIQDSTDSEVSTENPVEKPDGPWVEVGKNKRNKRKKEKAPSQATRKFRNKGDALILKTDEAKYAEVLKSMRRDTELKGLGADVRSIRRTRAGEMILELKKDAVKMGPTYKALAEKVLGKDVEVRALTTEMTLQLKNLDEITDAKEIAQALEEQCEVVVTPDVVRLRKGRDGTQVAAVRLPLVDAKKALDKGSLDVGWSICPVSALQQPDVCFRCFERGHKSYNCKGPDRSKLCMRCGGEGHKAKGCKQPPKCPICTGKRDDKHVARGPRCLAGVPGTKPPAR